MSLSIEGLAAAIADHDAMLDEHDDLVQIFESFGIPEKDYEDVLRLGIERLREFVHETREERPSMSAIATILWAEGVAIGLRCRT